MAIREKHLQKSYFDDVKQHIQRIKLRGLHLDPSRHFISIQKVLEIIEIFPLLQLNTLHLHLSDDQGFPIELNCLLQLDKPIIKNPNYQTWSIQEQEMLSVRCEQLGIKIIPEIDIPGHATAFLSLFNDEIKIEQKMGIISQNYISIQYHLDIILQIYDELTTRFKTNIDFNIIR